LTIAREVIKIREQGSVGQKKKRVVIAIGGNAILQAEQSGTFEEQFKNISLTANRIVSIIFGIHDFKIVALTHGNGPQVGNIAMQQDEANHGIPKQPMHILTAMTQGQIGYMLQQAIQNEIRRRLGKDIPVVSIVTQTVVDKNDAEFRKPLPSKPIGPLLTDEEAREFMKTNNYRLKQLKSNGKKIWRRVVPSPQPVKIVETDTLKKLVAAGCLVISSGGGGIPVIDTNGDLRGIDGVIDKDLVAGLLAKSVGASILIILTDIENVKLNYGKPNEISLSYMSLTEAKKFMEEGQFLDGSMGPKIRSSIDFLESGGEVAIITSVEKVTDALNGIAGTRISRRKRSSDSIN
jgi:carbamate kinase